MSSSNSGEIGFSVTAGSHKLDHTQYPFFIIETENKIGKVPHAVLQIHDGAVDQQDFPISDSKVLQVGQEITIEAGYHNALKPIFKGIIVRQSIRSTRQAPSMLVLECKDTAYRTTLVPKHRSFGGTSAAPGLRDDKIIKEVLSTYSHLSASVASTAVAHETLIQPGISDWDFINLRAEANGMIVLVESGTVKVKKPNDKQAATRSFAYGQDILEFDLHMDVRAQIKGVEGHAWDTQKKAVRNIKASEPGERSFGSISYSKLASFHQQPPLTLRHGANVSKQELETVAGSVLTSSRLAKVQGFITVEGHAETQPDQVVHIEKSAQAFQGAAYVTGVRHHLSEGEWTTQLTFGLPPTRYMHRYQDIAALPSAGITPPLHGLQIGLVKKTLGDPQKGHRIFVHIPLVHGPQEGIWCRMASLYASQDCGMVFTPEAEDEVVLGFIDGDPRHPVVVGSLYSPLNKPPVVNKEDTALKTIVSHSKLTIEFDDKDKVITLSTPNKQQIKISEKDHSIELINAEAGRVVLNEKCVEVFSKKDISLHAQGALTLQAGDNIQIKAGKALNMTGSNVSAKASMKASLSGKSSAELQSSATTIVKGMIVKIN